MDFIRERLVKDLCGVVGLQIQSSRGHEDDNREVCVSNGRLGGADVPRIEGGRTRRFDKNQLVLVNPIIFQRVQVDESTLRIILVIKLIVSKIVVVANVPLLAILFFFFFFCNRDYFYSNNHE